jgi:hypothetical protein
MAATFSWKRGLVHALGPAVVLFGLAAWHVHVAHPANPVRFWRLVAMFIAFEVALGLLASFFFQMGRRATSSLVVAAGTATVFATVLSMRARTEAVTLTPEERAPLVTVDDGGRPRLRHPTLGFSILHPGPGFVEAGRPVAAGGQFYRYADSSAPAIFMVGLFKSDSGSPAELRKLMEALGHQAGTLAGNSGAPVTVLRLDVPTDEPPRGEFHALVGEHKHYQLRAHGWRPPGRGPFAAMIAVMSTTPEAYTEVLDSFRP